MFLPDCYVSHPPTASTLKTEFFQMIVGSDLKFLNSNIVWEIDGSECARSIFRLTTQLVEPNDSLF